MTKSSFSCADVFTMATPIDSDRFKGIESFFILLKESKSQDNANPLLTFECVKCRPLKKTISSNTQAPYSNLKLHVKRIHGSNDLKDFEEAISKSRKIQTQNESAASSSTVTKSNPWEIAKQNASGTLTQKQYTKAIADLISSENLAFTIVRRPGWRKFLKQVQPKRDIPAYETIVESVSEQFEEMMAEIKRQLALVNFVGCSTDGWTAVRKSYLGYTCTWLDSNFNRIVVAIACRRFIGSQNYATVTPHMCEIMDEFQIQVKCQGFTTDGATYYEKAFVEFGIEPLDVLDDDDEEGSDDIEFEQIDINASLQNENNLQDDDHDYSLPPRAGCGAHKLNNVAKIGTKEAMKNKNFSKIAHVVFGKVRAIWNSQNRSTSKADFIRNTYGFTFVVPGETRWNAFFDGITDFCKKISQSEDKLSKLCKELEFRAFTDIEISLLEEYLKVMKPVALALDLLQGDIGLGHILPIITDVFSSFEEMDDLIYCDHLKTCLEKEVESRFKHLFYDQSHVLASLSDPQYKNYWINDPEYMEFANDLFSKAVKKFSPKDTDEPKPKVPKMFGQFAPKAQCSNESNIAKTYLSNPSKDVTMLKNYPVVEKIYRKTNTTFASSASVERMFSRGKLIFRSNCYNLKDENFEKKLLIQCNQSFLNRKKE